MKRSFAATVGVAAASLVATHAQGQSLSDAINGALDNNCLALGGAAPRYTDTYQYDQLTDTIDFSSTDPSVAPATISPPLDVPDGVGRTFVVRASTVSLLDPVAAAALTEAELAALFQQTGVERLVISRFESGLFGPGLSGLCQSIVEARTNTNGNTAGSGGFAGGSSSASGRSVSSLSSARDQSADNKKRKRKRKQRDRNSSYGDGYVRLASAEGGIGIAADAAGVAPFGVRTVLDFRGGYTDLQRDATALESGFDGRALWGRGAATAELSQSFAVAGAFSYQKSRGEFDGSSASGGANEFRDETYNGGVYLLWSLPLHSRLQEAMTLDLSVGGFYGGGSGSIERTFQTTRQATYLVDVTDPINVVDTLQLSRQTLISDDILGEYDTRNYGFSAAASISFDLAEFTLTPGVEYTRLSFRQDDYQEATTDAFNNGLALEFSEFKDHWSETRIGAALSRSFAVGAHRLRLEAFGDLVITGGASTPARSASFVDDLRAQPYVLSYQVDDLDQAFGRFGLVGAAELTDGIELFVGGETNVAHDYLRARTIFAGVRFTP